MRRASARRNRAVLALPARGAVEAQAKPGEVVENGGLVLRLAPRPIQVFNAQQQASAHSAANCCVAGAPNRRGRGAAPRWERGRIAGRASAGAGLNRMAQERMHKASARASRARPRSASKALPSRPGDRRRGGLARGGRRLARQRPRTGRNAGRDRRAAAASSSRAWLRRARRDHRFAAGLGRQRNRHLWPAPGADCAARSRPARRGDGGGAARLRAVGAENPRAAALAEAVAEGALDLAGLSALDAEDAHKKLVAVKGVGPWTADIFLLFCLGHPDAFPAGDLALQEAAKLALRLKRRPDAPGSRRLPSAGGLGAASPPACSGPITGG